MYFQTEFIDNILRQVHSEGVILGLHTTVYLVQGLLSVQHMSVDYQHLFKHSPVLTTSIQVKKSVILSNNIIMA